MNPRERTKLLQVAEGYFRAGNHALARLALENLVASDASSSRAFELLGYVNGNDGRLAEAHDCLVKACGLPKPSPEAWYYLGVSYLKQGLAEPAVGAFDRAIALAGPFFEALHDRGTAYSQLGRNAPALENYRRAFKLKPDSFDLVFNIGKVYDKLKDFGQALAYYDRALRLDPNVADVWAHKGAVLYDAGRYAEAIDHWERALSIEPLIDHLRGFLFHARLRLCDWRRWESERADLLARFERGENACGPFEMLAISGDEEVQSRCAQRWVAANLNRAPAAVTFPRSERDRIRVGYFSADFGRHAVSYLTAEIFELHDRDRFEIVAFALNKAAPDDEVRERLARAFDQFVEVDDASDGEIVGRARSLGLDIAVDLGGHTKGSRTAVLRDRVAPVQVNFLGFPGTMGAGFIDYVIADETAIPGPSRVHYAERVVWLPECFQPSDTRRSPAMSHRPRREFGLPEDGFVFCCFNNTYKINPEVFASWIRILDAVEGSCLWLLAEGEQVETNLRGEAVRAGIEPDRLVFGGRLALSEYLGRFRCADLFLDTLPFNAGTTANDALFTGLPVLTRCGKSFAGRMAASLLKALDLPELVVESRDEYEATAIRLARQPAEVARIKSKLAQNLRAGPLFDMPRYTRHLEAAYFEMRRRWREGLAPDDFRVTPAAQPRG